ncbi:hypothetical protein E0W37_08705 [Neisseria meningitidis]|nr:hypothetical protein [Neisseria meningitidis]
MKVWKIPTAKSEPAPVAAARFIRAVFAFVRGFGFSDGIFDVMIKQLTRFITTPSKDRHTT